MDSGNSGSISSSGDEEYDSRNHNQTLLPSNLFNQQPTLLQFNSISHNPLQSFNPGSSPISLFDLSPNYLQNLSQSQPPNITFPTSQGVSSSSQHTNNQCLLTTPHQTLGVLHHDDDDNINNNARTTLSSPQPPSSSRNTKKRTRASRRAPTTVLTTDTSNFRAMVQEFTGIPAPPFSGSSYSRRLDLLTSSSSLRSSNSSHFDNTTSPLFYPLRPSPQKLHHHHNHPNPLLLSSSSSSSHNNMVDANNSNYQQLPISDLGLPYYSHQNHHQQHNFMLSMQNQQPIHAFNPSSSSQQFHPFSIGGFGAKSQSQHGSLSVNSLEDLGVNQGHLGHDDEDGGSRRDALRCLDHENSYGGKIIVDSSSSGGGGGVGSNCKVNFSGTVSTTLNHDKTMENNNNNNDNDNNRGEGAAGGGGVDSWICSSDRNIL
ncbi:putative uncharacterized protein DDB_G0277255 isoform X2 [Trifolium pratense]|uniref:putative uncharacterized protein DDB_G0277255 isoform X2 n=1 Tax=Trifolium pratense TaxID=57577 RepID=UPI001E6972B9|nr:putative uncharacterized protein DDB_G0277255 isoform X2 [Trifolium pratense]